MNKYFTLAILSITCAQVIATEETTTGTTTETTEVTTLVIPVEVAPEVTTAA